MSGDFIHSDFDFDLENYPSVFYFPVSLYLLASRSSALLYFFKSMVFVHPPLIAKDDENVNGLLATVLVLESSLELSLWGRG